jgi:hypothetical protein
MSTIFNTIEVTTGRVARIINFLESSPEFFIAIGKSTPWNQTYGLNINDNNPPFPLDSQLEILEPILYKRIKIGVGADSVASAASMQNQCQENTNDEVLSSVNLIEQSAAQNNLTFFSLQDLKNNQDNRIHKPEFIYIQGEILDTDYTNDSWRCSALYTKLFLQPNVPTTLELYTPQQVKGGLLHHVTYNSPVLRQVGKTHKFEYIITV